MQAFSLSHLIQNITLYSNYTVMCEECNHVDMTTTKFVFVDSGLNQIQFDGFFFVLIEFEYEFGFFPISKHGTERVTRI